MTHIITDKVMSHGVKSYSQCFMNGAVENALGYLVALAWGSSERQTARLRPSVLLHLHFQLGETYGLGGRALVNAEI